MDNIMCANTLVFLAYIPDTMALTYYQYRGALTFVVHGGMVTGIKEETYLTTSGKLLAPQNVKLQDYIEWIPI